MSASSVVSTTPGAFNDVDSIRSAMSFGNILTSSTSVDDTSLEAPQGADAAVTNVNDELVNDELVNDELGNESDKETTEDGNTQDDNAQIGHHVHREFICMNDEFSECQTGQYVLNLSRKVISNHFGRNKACTRAIRDWPLFCRKHYQRATYNSALWQRRKINLILRQFDVIEARYPGTTYKVSLKKSEMDRLNLFSRLSSSGTSIKEAGEAVASSDKVRSYQAPIDVLRELQYELGEDKSIDDVKKTLSVINDMLREGQCTEVPSIEFLPQLPGRRRRRSPSRKTVRVSAKGRVQKPRRN